MKKPRRFQDRLREDLKNEEFKKAFDEEEVYAELAIKIAKIRQEEHVTQQELARRLRTSQQMVSRLEQPENASLSLKTLIKLARALNKRLSIELI